MKTKKRLRAELEAEETQNVILRARNAWLNTFTDELTAEVDEKSDWFSPESLPAIVETVLDELIVQLLEHRPKVPAMRVHIGGKEIAAAVSHQFSKQMATN